MIDIYIYIYVYICVCVFICIETYRQTGRPTTKSSNIAPVVNQMLGFRPSLQLVKWNRPGI